MSRFSIKNIMLGIGIGIVFMSIISLIYMAGSDPTANLTENDLARIADRYGLIKRTDVIDKNSSILSTETTGSTEAGSSSESRETTSATSAAGQSTSSSSVTEAAMTVASATEASKGASTVGTTVSGGNNQEVLFVIKSGETSEQIAANLHKNGLIDNETDFIKLIGGKGLEDNIRAGEFKINRKADMNEIIKVITK